MKEADTEPSKMSLRKVLLVVDDDGHELEAIETAATLAARHGSAVTVLEVLPESGLSDDLLDGVISLDELRTTLEERRAMELEQLVAGRSKRFPGALDVKVVTGIPFIEIIREAVNGGYDLITKTAEDRKARVTGRFGSTDMHLLRKSPLPLWITVPRGRHEIRRVLAAVDVLNPDEEAAGFNRQILATAHMAATTCDASLEVLSAWHVEGESLMQRSASRKVPGSQLSHILNRIEHAARSRQAQLMEWYRRTYPETDPPAARLVKGFARQAITEHAWDHDMDLIVMGTVGRTGIKGFLIGNTAESVLSALDRSVLAIKPEGFVTPVELKPLAATAE